METAFRPKYAGRNASGKARQIRVKEVDEESPSSIRPKPKQRSVRVAQRRPIRFHRIYNGKTKRWRDNSAFEDDIKAEKSKQSPRRSPRPPKIRIDARLGGTDPFNAFGLINDRKTDLALHHWTSVFQNTMIPLTPRKPWLQINLSDKTLLSVTTYCSTAHWYFCRAIRPPASILPQKVLAIGNINNALRKTDTDPSDYIMVAVCVMTILECLAGDPKECAIHRKGLQLMLRRRGGLRTLGFNGGAQRAISWADTCCAIFERAKPTLKPILIPNAGEDAFVRRYEIGNLRERLLQIIDCEDLANDALYVWRRLRYLYEFVANASDDQIDDCLFTDKIDHLERQVLSLLHSSTLGECGAVAFMTAFLNASLIFIYEELRTCPRWTNVCMTLSQRICSGLSLVDMATTITGTPDLLLWTLLLGRSGVPPPPQVALSGAWYEKEIAAALEGSPEVKVLPVVRGMMYYTIAEAARPNASTPSKATEREDTCQEE
ncbi:hypothetical protein B0O99DRAFT_692572 [Bisporella sp. PMI_857]|nr:hypothetical protein B0O99DRAFT_692572 [Bisporella sp. PMI_857]